MSAAEDNVNVDIEAKARKMGWRPQSEYKGDPEKFIPAKEYVERGEQFIPFLKANNRTLETKVGTLSNEVNRLTTLISANQETIVALKEMATEQAKAAAKNARDALIKELRQARTDGDVDREIAIQEQIQDTNTALRDADKKPVQREQQQQTRTDVPGVQSPEWKQFLEDNPWFMANRRMAAYATALAAENAANAEFMALPATERWKRIAEETQEFFESKENPRKRATKVEGGGSGGGDGGGQPKTYAALPAEAKEACDRFAKRVVGEGRAFKTIEDFRKDYAEKYFA